MTRYTKELPERPALPAGLSVRTEDGQVVMEPAEVHGTVGFSLYLSRERANALGHALIRAAVALLPPTVKP